VENDLDKHLAGPDQRKVGIVLRTLQGHQDVLRANKYGELVYKKQSIKGSNFAELMNYLFRPDYELQNKLGIEELFKGLTDLDVKDNLITNPTAQGRLAHQKTGLTPKKKEDPRRGKQKGRGHDRMPSPPGKRPRIMQMYSW